jgi:hypothetical protein
VNGKDVYELWVDGMAANNIGVDEPFEALDEGEQLGWNYVADHITAAASVSAERVIVREVADLDPELYDSRLKPIIRRAAALVDGPGNRNG